MEMALVLIGLVIVGVIVVGISQGVAAKNWAEEITKRVKGLKDFNASDVYVSGFNRKGFAIDSTTGKVLFIKEHRYRYFDPENLISSEILIDNTTITTTSRGSQLVGAAVGGGAIAESW